MKSSIAEGEDRGDVRLYALSSCAWCGKVKDLLDRLGVTYRFVDADLLEEKEEVAVRRRELWISCLRCFT